MILNLTISNKKFLAVVTFSVCRILNACFRNCFIQDSFHILQKFSKIVTLVLFERFYFKRIPVFLQKLLKFIKSLQYLHAQTFNIKYLNFSLLEQTQQFSITLQQFFWLTYFASLNIYHIMYF